MDYKTKSIFSQNTFVSQYWFCISFKRGLYILVQYLGWMLRFFYILTMFNYFSIRKKKIEVKNKIIKLKHKGTWLIIYSQYMSIFILGDLWNKQIHPA